MKNVIYMEKKKIFTFAFLIMFFLEVLFSVSFLMENIHHRHIHESHDDCPVCLLIDSCIIFISSILEAFSRSIVLLGFVAFILFRLSFSNQDVTFESLITNKVKIND